MIEVEVTGNGQYYGAKSNIVSYTVNEDATPADPDGSAPAAGQIRFDVVEDPSPEGTALLLNDTIQLTDGTRGVTTGIINEVNVASDIATITADSRLILLTATRTVAPFTGTLPDAFRHYMTACGVTTGILFDDAVPTVEVALPGFTDVVWRRMNELALVYEVDISLVSENIVFRPMRTREVVFERDTVTSWAVANSELAQFVDVHYYNNEYRTNLLVYPRGGWTTDTQVYSVDAGEIVDIEISVDASLVDIQQPTCQTFVAKDYVGPTSVYSVIGADGLPIPPAQWAAQGGSLTVSIDEDPSIIRMRLVGASEARYSPYRIAVGAGPSDYYSSLRLIASGVFYEDQIVRIPTGVSPERTAQEVGTEIKNPAISTHEQATRVGVRAAQRYSGIRQTINITSVTVNRSGESGNLQYPTFDEMDARFAGDTFNQVDTVYSGMTFNQVTALALAEVRNNFENQAFGNVAGARRKFREAYYRIDTATITQDDVQYTAERDTLFNDVDAIWEGATFDDVSAQFDGKTFDDMAVIPLWRTA